MMQLIKDFLKGFIYGMLVLGPFVLIMYLFSSCGSLEEKETIEVRGGNNGASCTDTSGDRNADGIVDTRDCMGETGAEGRAGAGCAVQEVDEGALISCGGVAVLVAHGKAGAQGAQGPAGEAGPKGARGRKGDTGPAGAVETETLIYRGYACGKTIVSLGTTYYVIHGQLISINDSWASVSSNCEVMYDIDNNQIITQDPTP